MAATRAARTSVENGFSNIAVEASADAAVKAATEALSTTAVGSDEVQGRRFNASKKSKAAADASLLEAAIAAEQAVAAAAAEAGATAAELTQKVIEATKETTKIHERFEMVRVGDAAREAVAAAAAGLPVEQAAVMIFGTSVQVGIVKGGRRGGGCKVGFVREGSAK